MSWRGQRYISTTVDNKVDLISSLFTRARPADRELWNGPDRCCALHVPCQRIEGHKQCVCKQASSSLLWGGKKKACIAKACQLKAFLTTYRSKERLGCSTALLSSPVMMKHPGYDDSAHRSLTRLPDVKAGDKAVLMECYFSGI